jgi:hypothetical protein
MTDSVLRSLGRKRRRERSERDTAQPWEPTPRPAALQSVGVTGHLTGDWRLRVQHSDVIESTAWPLLSCRTWNPRLNL